MVKITCPKFTEVGLIKMKYVKCPCKSFVTNMKIKQVL